MASNSDVDMLLAVPLVALLHRPMAADDLARTLAEQGLEISPSRVETLLERLAKLGLARIATEHGNEPAYVATSLGQLMSTSTLTGQPELAAGLEELERLRSDLLATIGHELRTPLTSIRTSIGLLLDPGLTPSDEQRQQLLVTIARSADRMQHLLAELLDFARLRSGAVELNIERIDARDVMREVIMALEPLATARGQRIRRELPEQPVALRGDRRRLEQALLNLASNAHKFTPLGGEISLRLSADGGHVRWSVEDHGQGIPTDEVPRLFERFFVGDRMDGRRGVGLGLPTALAIAQAHGGTVDVESEEGRGSIFTLVVPCATS